MCRLDGQYLTDGSEEEEEEDVDEDDLEEWLENRTENEIFDDEWVSSLTPL